jgi:hypothetical protein
LGRVAVGTETTDGQRSACGPPTASPKLGILCVVFRSSPQPDGFHRCLTLDPSGAALRGAVVVLNSQETSAIDSATSNGEGDFSFLRLLPGDYEVKVSKTGPGSSHRQCDSKRQSRGNSPPGSTSTVQRSFAADSVGGAVWGPGNERDAGALLRIRNAHDKSLLDQAFV